VWNFSNDKITSELLLMQLKATKLHIYTGLHKPAELCSIPLYWYVCTVVKPVFKTVIQYGMFLIYS